MGAALSSRIKIMAGLDIAERRVAQDGGIHVMMDRRPIDLRVSTMPGRFGEKVVIRVIDNDKASVNLEKLGFGYETLKEWRKLLALPNGIILVTGPTGSGKSTTLYACLQEINDDDINICTIEDPIEYNLRGVNQFQINDKAGFSFTSALRALLRQGPDVMMIGEIRDGETARLATQAALTGHLIFSTLHTNDAPGAITRLYNLGIEPYLVGATVVGCWRSASSASSARTAARSTSRRRTRSGRSSGSPARSRSCTSPRLQQVPPHRLRRPRGRVRTVRARRRDDRKDQQRGDAQRRPRGRDGGGDAVAADRRAGEGEGGDHDAGRSLPRTT
jgi:type II secretory ATPase GspE/PulE/Tfp pilus assembly ATPase PilB-like protein